MIEVLFLLFSVCCTARRANRVSDLGSVGSRQKGKLTDKQRQQLLLDTHTDGHTHTHRPPLYTRASSNANANASADLANCQCKHTCTVHSNNSKKCTKQKMSSVAAIRSAAATVAKCCLVNGRKIFVLLSHPKVRVQLD